MAKKHKKAEIYLKDYLTGKLQTQAENRKLEILHPPRRKQKDLGVKVQTSSNNDQLEREVLSYVDDGAYVFLKNKISNVNKCLEFIRKTDELTYRILILYYEKMKTWVYVSNVVNMSQSACIRRRDKALKELDEWL